MINLSKALGIFRDKVSSVKKGTINPFFKSKYADLPSILEVIKDPLKEAGLCLYHAIKNTEGGYVVVTTIAHEESAESISSEFPVFGGKPQEIGSSITYARRYNIQAMLDIPTEDDDANASNTTSRVKTEYKPKADILDSTFDQPFTVPAKWFTHHKCKKCEAINERVDIKIGKFWPYFTCSACGGFSSENPIQ